MYASVVVNVSSSNVDRYFEYSVPSHMESFIQVGQRVKVPFSDCNRVIMGVVLSVQDTPNFNGEHKEIIELLDLVPILSEEDIKLAMYVRNDTVCPLTRVLNLMIPDALQLKTFKYISLLNRTSVDANLLTLFKDEDTIEYSSNLYPYKDIIKQEIENKNLVYSYDAVQVVKPKFGFKYLINSQLLYDEFTFKTKKYYTFLQAYKECNTDYTVDEIMDKFDVSIYMLNKLEKEGYLEKKYFRIFRNRKEDFTTSFEYRELPDEDLELITQFENNDKPYLYMPKDETSLSNVICGLSYLTLKQNKNVVIICSDILSSYKYAKLLRLKLGLSVACINSNISKSEYLDIYDDLKNDFYRVIVTTPKGAFLPFRNVGLYFMVDEESENYYNDQSPRYDLKKVFNYRTFGKDIKLVLESRSPSVSSYCYGLKNVYTIINEAQDEVKNNVSVVDMQNELKLGNNTYLSSYLKKAIEKTSKNKLAAMLIVNNKSYASYVICRVCGDVPKCPYCEISLNYNEKKNELMCPACGYHIPYLEECTKCHSKIRYFGGVGIESMKELIDKELNYLKALVLDTTKKDTYFQIMNALDEYNVDIIITTETYAKSIYHQNIGLVGIINFDGVLKTPSYDANSRAYCMLANLNNHLPSNGELVVQTTYKEASPLVNFIKGEFSSFMREEIMMRKNMHNEPFYHINRIIIRTTYDQMFKTAVAIKTSLKEICGNALFIIGPTYSKRFSGCVLIIKHNYKNINAVYKKIYEHYQNSTVEIIFDKYPRKL